MMIAAPAFRDALARVAMPVSVVTTLDPAGTACGVTVGSLSSLSLSPPLIMFGLDRSGRSHQVLTTAPRLLVHVLRDAQSPVAARFARLGTDRFAGLTERWHGLPAIPGATVRLACRQHAIAAGGDHTVVICAVEDAEVAPGDPLLYYDRSYSAVLPSPQLPRTAPLRRITECPPEPRLPQPDNQVTRITFTPTAS